MTVLRALRLGEEKHRMRRLELERDQLRAELAGLRQVQGLNHLVPVCASCKKIRNERNEWMTMENYFEHRHGLRLTHGLCVACVTNYYRSMGVLPPIDE